MIKTATFIKSAVDRQGWIVDQIPEICFLGRSNVGKSSFINAFTNQKKLAKTSSTPGKTKLLNFFDINEHEFRIVDAPGYGFAKISKKEKKQFIAMMDDFLLHRTNLCGVVLFLDLRHLPTPQDVEIYRFLKKNSYHVLVIGTKLDKLKQNERQKNENQIKTALHFQPEDRFVKISSLTKENLTTVYEELKSLLERVG